MSHDSWEWKNPYGNYELESEVDKLAKEFASIDPDGNGMVDPG